LIAVYGKEMSVGSSLSVSYLKCTLKWIFQNIMIRFFN